MEHESFESVEVAAILNSSFIPIKVDRESQHDIDEIYMHYVTATTGSGGWPLNVFLTPSLEPVFGGTYWPSPYASSLPGRATRGEEALTFLDVLEKMRDVWQTQRQKCLTSAKEITQQLKQFAEEGTHSQATRINDENSDSSEPLELDLLEDAFNHFETRYDPTYGGFSTSAAAPKFPTPPNLLFLLRAGGQATSPFTYPQQVHSVLGLDSASKALRMASHTLLQMSRGGIRDHLGYGFARYSVTPDWNLPHFEKMLTDNAQLLSAYSMAFASTHEPEHLAAIYSLISYLTATDSPIVSSTGALYSSEDADSSTSNSHSSETREGAYYLFTHKEVHTILSNLPLPIPKPTTQYPQVPANAADILCRHFNILPDGNIPSALDPHDSFLSTNVLSIAATPSVLSREFGLPESSIVQILRAARSALAAHRASARTPPAVDTKIVTAYNALAITGLLDAALALRSIDKPRATSCLAAARKIADFLHSHLYIPSTHTLYRIYFIPPGGSANRSGGLDPTVPAFADDYAYLIRALLSLYSLTGSGPYFLWAVDLQSTFNKLYGAPSPTNHPGFYTSPIPATSNTDTTQPPGSSNSSFVPPILRLKSGTDTSLPSPNGIAASNLLIFAAILPNNPNSGTSYENASDEPGSAYALRAQNTLSAFAIEILQHPFLFVSLLDALIARELGFESIVLNLEDVGADTKAHDSRSGSVGVGVRLARWGRTVLYKGEGYVERWVAARNRMVGEWRSGVTNVEGLEGSREGMKKSQATALWCSREGTCRIVRVEEIEEGEQRGVGGGG